MDVTKKKDFNLSRFLVSWAAVFALVLCFILFTVSKGSAFMSSRDRKSTLLKSSHNPESRYQE